MKLLVILLCVLSERYLVHALSTKRFFWFSAYVRHLDQQFGIQNPAAVLLLIVLPLLLISWIFLLLANHLFFGLLAFLVHLIIFYYCLGPDNIFYPYRQHLDKEYNEKEIGRYFIRANSELFAPIFWYVILGPLGILLYRLISLSQSQKVTAGLAAELTQLLDWIPARITVLLYLLVGNFQQGFRFYSLAFLSKPEFNDKLLSQGGIHAAMQNDAEFIQFTYAENIVEYSLILFLVFIAFFTLVAWF